MKHIRSALLLTAVSTVLFGILYPLVMTGIAQLIFPKQANGVLVVSHGTVTGSALIGQSFTNSGYFHGRPSYVGYDGNGSGSSNFGPMNAEFISNVERSARAVRMENGLPANAVIPADLVTASGSGLDPHISLAGAKLQAQRIAQARGISPAAVNTLIDATAERRYHFFGAYFVNIITLNNALDNLSAK